MIGNPIRVYVCGGHDYNDAVTLRRVLDAVRGSTGVAALLEGGDGVGLMAAEWAVSHAIPVLTLRRSRREEELGGRDARVQRILTEGRPDFVIGFPGGHRTADLLERFERAGLRVYRVPVIQGDHAAEKTAKEEGSIRRPVAERDVSQW